MVTSTAVIFGLAVLAITHENDTARAFLMAGAGFSNILFSRLRARQRRLRVPSAEQVLADDARPPVLWLRPFDLDGAGIRTRPMSWRSRASEWRYGSSLGYGQRTPTYEEHLGRLLRDVAPVIALGDPAEPLPRLGAARVYADDDGWRSTVAELLARDGTIILHIGDSPRLRWEAQQVIELDRPESLIVSLPRHGELRRLRRRRRRAGVQRPPPAPARGNCSRRHHYRELRLQLGDLFPAGLPWDIGDSQFVYFDADWKPSLFPVRGGQPPPPRAGSASEQRDLILGCLGEQFRILRTPVWVPLMLSLAFVLGTLLLMLLVPSTPV